MVGRGFATGGASDDRLALRLRLPRLRGVDAGCAVVDAVSAAETLLAVQLEQADIPFEREFRFAPPRRWRADFYVDRARGVYAQMGTRPIARGPLLIEIDGGGFVAGRHTRGTGFENDAEKASAAAILGYRVIRATPRQVEDGRCLSWIRQALGIEAAA